MHKVILVIIIGVFVSGCASDTVGVSAIGTWLNHDRRNAKTIIEDNAISVKANLAIAKNQAIWKDSHISTLSYNNSLLLVGQTKTPSNKDYLPKLLEPIEGISAIYNQVTVGSPLSIKCRTNDTWITTQVKARIISNRDVGINRVKVITEDNTVYLMGSLTQDEEQIAVNITRRVPGVKKVVTIIERPDPVE